MNYHNILHDDMLNGEGLRVVIFVSGCVHNCDECHNPQTHPLDSGIPFTEQDKEELFYYLSMPHTKGITFTGGDPLLASNATTICKLCKEIKEKFPDKDIWVYTGYLYENLQGIARECLNYIDVLVDGKYDKRLKDVNLPYAGSHNQRVIDVKESIKQNKVIRF